MVRQPDCDFLLESDLIFARLKEFSEKLLAVPAPCADCEFRSQCFICPPVYKLHADSRILNAACKCEQKRR